MAKVKSFSKSERAAHGVGAIVTFGGAVGSAYGARHFFERAITNAAENNAPAAAGNLIAGLLCTKAIFDLVDSTVDHLDVAVTGKE